MKFPQTYKCPRCKLPQKGTHRCQYCGYVFPKNKLHTKSIRNKLKDIFDVFNKGQMNSTKKPKLKDSAGTRAGTDRRKYRIMNYFPERRSGNDRRKKIDRKGQMARNRP